MTDVHRLDRRSYNMSRIRAMDTKPEVTVRSLLHRAGFRFRKNVSGLPGKPDILLPKYKTAIFVQGCFWHRHKGCRYSTSPASNKDFWEAKFLANVKRDKENISSLKRLGWSVELVWECDIKKDAAKAVNLISKKLRSRVQ